MRSRMCLLNMVGGADWGWSRESMRMIFTATQRSVAEYGCPAWAPWISKSGMEKIETVQRLAARRCTGATLSTSVEAVNREAGLEDLRVRYQQMAVQQFERWSQLEEGDPRRELTEREVAQRTKKKDWREHSRRLHREILQDTHNPPSPAMEPPPWRAGVPGIVYAQTDKTESGEQQLRAAREALETAGEASGGCEAGGGGCGRCDLP